MKSIGIFLICVFFITNFWTLHAQDARSIYLTAQTDSTRYIQLSENMTVNLKNNGDSPAYFFRCCSIKHSSQKKNDINEWGESSPIFCSQLCGTENIKLDTNSIINALTSPPLEVGVYRYIYLYTLDSTNKDNYDSLYTNEFTVYDNTTEINSQEMDYSDNLYISQIYPNPANPMSSIEYYIPREMEIKIEVIDLLGQILRTLDNSAKSKGKYKLNIASESLCDGVYFIRFQTNNKMTAKKFYC